MAVTHNLPQDLFPASPAMDDQLESYWQAYQSLSGMETAKNKLFEVSASTWSYHPLPSLQCLQSIKQMLTQLQTLNNECQQAKLDLERETQFNRDYQRERLKLQGEIKDHRGQTVRSARLRIWMNLTRTGAGQLRSGAN